MLYKKLGKTDLTVSNIGFGGIPIQRITSEEAIKVIRKAEELGINFIDSAKGYTVSEAYIGKALEGHRDKWILATKSMARTYKAMEADIISSLENFKTDYIDLYQLHNVKDMDTYRQIFEEDGAVKALVDAKKTGKVRHIGITAHSMTTLEAAIESEIFETIMYPYNIIENQAEKLFERAYKCNIGIIAMKPLAGGVISDGMLAMKYIINNSNITIALPGMESIDEVIQNCSAAEDIATLTEHEMDVCNKIREELGQTFCRRCGYCQPCTKGIDIPNIFVFKGYYDNYDLKDWALGRYKVMSAHASDCIECGNCEKKCPYDLPIIEKLKRVKETFGY